MSEPTETPAAETKLQIMDTYGKLHEFTEFQVWWGEDLVLHIIAKPHAVVFRHWAWLSTTGACNWHPYGSPQRISAAEKTK